MNEVLHQKPNPVFKSGGDLYSHYNHISCLAIRLAKATIFLEKGFARTPDGITPFTVALLTTAKSLNIDFQRFVSLGQNQNICESVAGACLPLSLSRVILGIHLTSFVLDQCN